MTAKTFLIITPNIIYTNNMELHIKRKTTNRLYTEGTLYVNGSRQTFTVESTEIMLPSGKYTCHLVKKNAHCRELIVECPADDSLTPHPCPLTFKIGICASWIGCKKDKIIGIGQYLIPGALYKAAPDYERLIKRLEKCVERKEPIELFVTERDAIQNQPIKYWLEPPMHGCPPSRQHVEADLEGNVTILYGDGTTKYISIEQQIQARLSNLKKR